MSSPTEEEKAQTRQRIRAALDILEHYVTDDGKIDATKLTQRIAELEAERQGWLDKLEARGPGLEAYREMGARIEELERENRRLAGLIPDYGGASEGDL